MIAVDTNVLVYAHRADSPLHDAARSRVRELAEGSAPWALPVFCIGEFLRVTTHRRYFDDPHSIAEARRAVERLIASPSVRVLRPGERFTELLLDAFVEAGALGNRVFDAQIVALCREWSVARLLTQDRGFGQWRGLEVETLDDVGPRS